MSRFIQLLCALPLVLTVGTAYADVPNDPCAGSSEGDPCTTLDGEDGSCEDAGGSLECQLREGGEDDGGCAVSTVGRHGNDALAVSLLAMAAAVAVRRRRR